MIKQDNVGLKKYKQFKDFRRDDLRKLDKLKNLLQFIVSDDIILVVGAWG